MKQANGHVTQAILACHMGQLRLESSSKNEAKWNRVDSDFLQVELYGLSEQTSWIDILTMKMDEKAIFCFAISFIILFDLA